MNLATAVLVVSAVAAPLFAGNAEDVLKVVVPHARGMVGHYGVAPAVFATSTRGGAMRSAEEWLWNTRPGLLASELADDYYAQNKAEHAIEGDVFPPQVLTADLREFESGNGYDWSRLSQKFPRVKSAVVVSEPAFDSLGTTAVVRVDIIEPAEDGGFTAFWDLERQPQDGSWKVKHGSIHTRTAMYRTDIHAGHMPNQCPVPADKRHPS